jgi:phenylpyruvate tautomerase PptA (4-oxalocrotonate tautomerase family)
MPLVRLTGAYDGAVLSAAGEAVHEAMAETLGVPADDVFRVLDAVAADAILADPGYLGIRRERPLFVEVTLRAGRSDEQKRAFYRRVAELIAERAGVRGSDVLVVLRENGLADWSFGDGIAQYAPAT